MSRAYQLQHWNCPLIGGAVHHPITANQHDASHEAEPDPKRDQEKVVEAMSTAFGGRSAKEKGKGTAPKRGRRGGLKLLE